MLALDYDSTRPSKNKSPCRLFFFNQGLITIVLWKVHLKKNQGNATKTEVSLFKKSRIAVTISLNASIRFSVNFIWKRRLPHWIWLVLLNPLETLRSEKSKIRFFAISIDLPRCSNPKINVIICFSLHQGVNQQFYCEAFPDWKS